MTFLAVSALAAYALLGGVALTVVLLHLLKPRPTRATVASTALWASVLKRRGPRAPRWRRLLSLLLALAIALSLALALTRPVALAGKRAVLVLDNSPSMAARTRDGRTRWEHAQARARAVLQRVSGDVMLVDTMGAAAVSGYLAPKEASAALERLAVRPHGVPRLPPFEANGNVELHLFTDGVALTEPPVGAVVHSVFEPADNVAVTALQARPFPADPTRYEAFVQVYNASPGPKRVRLSLRGAGGFHLEQPLEMAAGELIDASFDVTAFAGGILAAAASAEGDALPVDDIAFTRVAAHRLRKVLLVTAGNARLEDSLRALPGVQVAVTRPAAYPAAARPDAYVFDRFAPPEAPTAGALLFRPPPAPWLPERSRDTARPRVTGWDAGHPLSAGQSWRDLRVERARLAVAPGVPAVVSAPQGALIAAHAGPVPWILVGFAPQDSNLPLQPGFPVFLGVALDWLTDPAPPSTRPLGMIEVPLPHAQVRDGRGTAVPAIATADGIVFEAARPDVYTAANADHRVQVIAGVLDPRDAEINRTSLGERARPAATAGSGGPAEPWMLLLFLAALLAMIEWAAYTGRVTA